jgi:hypothetical protein
MRENQILDAEVLQNATRLKQDIKLFKRGSFGMESVIKM